MKKKLINMGIDPKNHRLTLNLGASGTAKSSPSKSFLCEPVKVSVENDHISDAGSCLQNKTHGLPDLNLDLRISIPSP